MANTKQLTVIPAFDEIVFEDRNKEYGAYVLRKSYKRNVVISLLAAIAIMTASVIIPFLKAKGMEGMSKRSESDVSSIVMSNIEPPAEKITVPETPPPPADVVQQAKYVPPVVVDSVKPEDDVQLITADDARDVVQNEDVIDIPAEVPPEIEDEVTEEIPYTIVQEMPSFPGGNNELLKYVFDNLVYPELARENNIQGRVTVKFCVTSTGGVSQISVMKGVDPELDKEVVRVISTLPPFKPGKQNGRPVPVWYVIPITFKLAEI